ncbi:MAG: FkbM family methyltransferase [Bacteroidota bacterium]
MMRYVPFGLKYGIGQARRKDRFPYKLIDPGKTVVQVGAPIDTLGSGRSRAMHFALRTGAQGKTVIIEPDSASQKMFESHRHKRNLKQIHFVNSGAWSEKKTLRFYIDPKHPATNFTEGVRQYSEKEMAAYQLIELEADTIDHILEDLKIDDPYMVSITTNGAEPEIIKGLQHNIAKGLPFICLARTGEKYIELMNQYGYELYAHDDRGYTFKNLNFTLKN